MNEDYVEIDGVSYPDRASYLAYSLGMCPCGCWTTIAQDIEKVLGAMLLRHHDEGNDWNAVNKLGLNELYKELIFHVLDQAEFTEHGSSVPGWLQEKGRKVIENLKKFKPYES